MAEKQNFNCIRGDTRIFTITMLDNAGQPIDITGWTFYMTFKVDYEDATPVLEKIVTTHTDPTHGLTTITLAASDTKNIAAGNYLYDIRALIDTDVVVTLLMGTFIFDNDVTRL